MRSFLKRKAGGLMTHTPYGYRIEGGKAIIDETAAGQVKELFEGFDERRNLHSGGQSEMETGNSPKDTAERKVHGRCTVTENLHGGFPNKKACQK